MYNVPTAQRRVTGEHNTWRLVHTAQLSWRRGGEEGEGRGGEGSGGEGRTCVRLHVTHTVYAACTVNVWKGFQSPTFDELQRNKYRSSEIYVIRTKRVAHFSVGKWVLWEINL